MGEEVLVVQGGIGEEEGAQKQGQADGQQHREEGAPPISRPVEEKKGQCPQPQKAEGEEYLAEKAAGQGIAPEGGQGGEEESQGGAGTGQFLFQNKKHPRKRKKSGFLQIKG